MLHFFSDPTASGLGRFLPLGDDVKENFITHEHSWFDKFFLPGDLEQPLLTTNLWKYLKLLVFSGCVWFMADLPIVIPTRW